MKSVWLTRARGIHANRFLRPEWWRSFGLRRWFDRVGLLDERYCLDYGVEDLDYCEACRRAGLKVGVFDHCYVDRRSLASSFRGDPSAPRSFAKNKALFDRK